MKWRHRWRHRGDHSLSPPHRRREELQECQHLPFNSSRAPLIEEGVVAARDVRGESQRQQHHHHNDSRAQHHGAGRSAKERARGHRRTTPKTPQTRGSCRGSWRHA